MKTLLLLCATALLMASCGDCPCNSYNKDYLRDVPVSNTRSFN